MASPPRDIVTSLGQGFRACDIHITLCMFQGEPGAPGENGADGVGGEEVRRMGLGSFA